MSPEELAASQAAYERVKPELDRLMAKLAEKFGRPLVPLHETNQRGMHAPNVYDCCVAHGQPLDPWGLCHHACRRCEHEASYERIWTHKGSCAPGRTQVVRGA